MSPYVGLLRDFICARASDWLLFCSDSKVLGDQNGDWFISLKLTFSYANSASYGLYCRSRIHLPTLCIVANRYVLYLLYWVGLMHLPTVCNVVIWHTLLQYVLVQTHCIKLYVYKRNFLTSVRVFSDTQNFSVLTFSWLIVYLLLVHDTSHEVWFFPAEPQTSPINDYNSSQRAEKKFSEQCKETTLFRLYCLYWHWYFACYKFFNM
jgi:hypothetical protein